MMDELEIGWHNWYWITDTLDRIRRDRRENRRWQLMALLASVSAGTNGGDAVEFWQSLVDQTLTEAEQIEAAEAEERERNRVIEEENQAKLEAAMAAFAASGGIPMATIQSSH